MNLDELYTIADDGAIEINKLPLTHNEAELILETYCKAMKIEDGDFTEEDINVLMDKSMEQYINETLENN